MDHGIVTKAYKTIEAFKALIMALNAMRVRLHAGVAPEC